MIDHKNLMRNPISKKVLDFDELIANVSRATP